MYILKGFVTHSGLAINTPGINNALGELSAWSMTYSKEKGLYTNSSIDPKLTLVGFKSTQDDVEVTAPLASVELSLRVSDFLYQRTLNALGIAADHTEILNALINEFATEIENIEAGAIETDGQYFMPEWVGFSIKGEATSFKLWYVDSAFRNQYPESQITFVPPVWPLDNFFLQGEEVQALLSQSNISQITQKLQDAKGVFPETYIRVDQFDYHDPYSTTRIVPSAWGILVYGVAGNNIDSIIDALRDYILANSTHTRDEWAAILPDVFKRTEFLIVPNWNKYAIPPMVNNDGIHSSVMSPAEIQALLAAVALDYPALHVQNQGTMTGFPYRSLAVCSVGGHENRDGLFRIDQVYPDWIAVSSNHQDYNRMSLRTKNWHYMIADLLNKAFSFQEYSDIPVGTMKVVRDNRLWLAREYENRHWLVLCKASAV